MLTSDTQQHANHKHDPRPTQPPGVRCFCVSILFFCASSFPTQLLCGRPVVPIPVVSAPASLPLAGEEAVEQRLSGVVSRWGLEGEHVLQQLKGRLPGALAQQQGLGEGRPLPLEGSLAPHVVLQEQQDSMDPPPLSQPHTAALQRSRLPPPTPLPHTYSMLYILST